MYDRRDRLLSSLPAWGNVSRISPLPGGNRSGAALIELEGGRAVAKCSTRSQDAIAWLAPVLALASRAGFEVPRYLPSREGCLVVDGVTVETFIEGSPLPPARVPAVLPPIRDFHALTEGYPQRPGFASSARLLLIDAGGDVDLRAMPGALATACRSAWRGVAGPRQSVVHGDLNRGNLLATPSGGIGLIDWDEARVDRPLFDIAALAPESSAVGRRPRDPASLALLAWEVASCWRAEPEYARRLAASLEQG